MSGPQSTRPQFTGLSGLEAKLESYHTQHTKTKMVPYTSVDLVCLIPEKASDNGVKDYCKQPYRHACQSLYLYVDMVCVCQT